MTTPINRQMLHSNSITDLTPSQYSNGDSKPLMRNLSRQMTSHSGTMCDPPEDPLTVALGRHSFLDGFHCFCGDIWIFNQWISHNLQFPRKWNIQQHEYLHLQQQYDFPICVYPRVLFCC